MNIVKHNPGRVSAGFPTKFLSGFFDDFATQDLAGNRFSPSVDIAEASDAYEVHLAIPGLDKKDIEIEAKEGVLKISAERVLEDKKEDVKFLRSETHYGKFSKSFRIPETVDSSKIEASYLNGILVVSLPKDKKKVEAQSIKVG